MDHSCLSQNGNSKNLNAPFRDGLLNGETVQNLRGAQILIGQWRIPDNTVRPHMALGDRSTDISDRALSVTATIPNLLKAATPTFCLALWADDHISFFDPHLQSMRRAGRSHAPSL